MDEFTVPLVAGYAVGRMLGRGGSASVWLVTDEKTAQVFALKCFTGTRGGTGDGGSGGLPGEAAEEAVRREIRILSALEHEHLIRAHQVLRVAPGGSGGPGGLGLLLDYAAGGSLGDLVGSRTRLSIGETITVLTPIAQVLGYLHARGFTHGDVSPGNVLFTGYGKPMLSDVGIARMVGDASAVPDHGTAGFVDPSPLDAVRAGLQPERDVYSVAALGWYCLTGEPPRHTADRLPLPLLLPDVPPDLAEVLEAGLNADRRLRPTAVELATAIYRSAPPLAVDLALSVHPTVVPELLTRRRPPEHPAGAVRTGVRALQRRMSTSHWSALLGARQDFPFQAGEKAGRPEEPTPQPGARPGPAHAAGRRDPAHPGTAQPGPMRRRQHTRYPGRRGRLLLAVGAGAVVAGMIWAGPALGPGPAWEEPGKPPAAAVGSGVEGPGAGKEGLPAAVMAQLDSTDPLEAVRGLAAARSHAFSSGQLELLDRVNVPGSPAAAADARIRAGLQASGSVLTGFTSIVSDLHIQPGRSSGQAVVGLTSATTPYEERDASGALVAAGAPGSEQDLTLVLGLVDGNWRIRDVLPGS